MPVKVDKLGTHLQAYVETLPAITTLRLCNRFGTGPKCFINKLPTELIEQIEGLIVQSVREEHRKVWSKMYRCWTDNCEMLTDHHSVAEQFDLAHEHLGYFCEHIASEFCQIVTCDECEEHKCYAECSTRRFHECAKKIFCEERHAESQAKWQAELGRSTKHEYGFFSDHQPLLEKNFGISVWVSHLRCKRYYRHSQYAGQQQPYITTVSYLTLPNNKVREEDCDYGSGSDSIQTPVFMGAPPSQKSLKKFTRALKILGLEPSSERWQQAVAALPATYRDAEPLRNLAAAITWPQPTLLAYNNLDGAEDAREEL